MSEELIVKHCSPTLAGLKTGSLFSCEFAEKSELDEFLREHNARLSGKGLRMIPLRRSENSALIYVYRPELLKKDLRMSEVCGILEKFGYGGLSTGCCIAKLMNRIGAGKGFPHEIGCFLGYPPEDVRGFIENGAKGCKYSGCWKVYGSVENAKKLFARYKKCTDVYCRCYKNGKSIERLCVG